MKLIIFSGNILEKTVLSPYPTINLYPVTDSGRLKVLTKNSRFVKWERKIKTDQVRVGLAHRLFRTNL